MALERRGGGAGPSNSAKAGRAASWPSATAARGAAGGSSATGWAGSAGVAAINSMEAGGRGLGRRVLEPFRHPLASRRRQLVYLR